MEVTTARLFKSGNSQAVRLPKAFRLSGNEVEIFRRGGEITLREKSKGMTRAFDLLAELPADALPERPMDGPPQSRRGL
jgi:antitoxin VapB